VRREEGARREARGAAPRKGAGHARGRGGGGAHGRRALLRAAQAEALSDALQGAACGRQDVIG
jgi:hypothetical protein